MDLLDIMEIYIPVEAEVKRISVQSLPNSMLRRMGLPLSNPDVSRKLADSPEGVWISPVVLQKRGQKLTSHTGNGVTENMPSELWINSGPLRMYIVSPNRTAYEVLKNTMPGTRTSQKLLLHQDLALQTNREAVVVYRGNVYLFVKRPSRSQGQPGTPKKPASLSAVPSTSNLSSKSQKKELLNHRTAKRKHPTCTVTHRENKTDVTQQKKRDIFTSKTMCPVPLSTDGVQKMDGQSHEDAGGDGAFHSGGEQEELVNSVGCEMQEPGDEETESTGQHSDMSSTVQMDSGEVDPSSSQSRTRRESPGAADSSSSEQMESVFKELDQAEKIAQLKSRLSSALNNPSFSK